ncbi:MAG: mannosyl-3-phosphoglycerate phosphatase-related protein [Calditrichia bacterium]
MIVFTDLDGTLLDLNTYSWQPALPALEGLKKRRIPVVPVSSKTIDEILQITRQLQLSESLIAENGSVILHKGEKVTLGKTVDELLPVFETLGHHFPIKGFHQLSLEDIINLTGLSADEAKLAQKREFSIPFILTTDSPEESMIGNLEKQITSYGCRLRRGGRFYHLLGDTDKGHAIRKYLEIWRKERDIDSIITFGLGDAPNDLDMFYVVDYPIQVEKPGGGYHPLPHAPSSLIQISGEGPSGWLRAYQKIMLPKIHD